MPLQRFTVIDIIHIIIFPNQSGSSIFVNNDARSFAFSLTIAAYHRFDYFLNNIILFVEMIKLSIKS